MSRIILSAFLAAVFLAAPSAFGPAAPLGLSGSAQAQTKDTTVKSKTQHNTTATKPSSSTNPANGGAGGGPSGSGGARD